MSDLLPKNSTPLEMAAAETINLSAIEVPIREVWSPDSCRAEMLPWLAWALSVDEWDVTWTEQQKRGAIKTSCRVHQYKGTNGAVKSALESIGFSVSVKEWFAQVPLGSPHTFKLLIAVDQVGYDIGGLKKLERVVVSSKNLRSHIDSIDITAKSTTNLIVAAAAAAGHELVINYSGVTYPNGAMALDLMTDAAVSGEESTVAAIDSLHELLNSTMPIAYGW